jgi:hypothetical protein
MESPMRRPLLPTLILSTLAVASFAAAARAQDSSALINEALDKPVKLAINTELPNAMRGIAKETGVRIEADRKVWELLPWGEQTKVTATIENQTLRDALNAIAHKLGLETVLREQAVELRPMPALTRLGRRSTVQELQALDLLTATPLNLKNPSPTIKAVIDEVDRGLEAMKSPFAIEFRPGDAVKPDQAVAIARNATMAEALESLAKDTNLTWYPWGDSIVVVPKEVQVRNQLGRTLTTRYNNADISQVLTELAQQSGVEFSVEPGAIQRIAPEFRRVTLVLDNASVREALENISGFTGLGYVVNAKGVYLWNQSSTPAAPQQERSIGMIQLDNGVQIFLRPSDLDDDVRQYLEFRRKREIEKLREMMKEEGFKPAPSTQPTQPATAAKEPKRDL